MAVDDWPLLRWRMREYAARPVGHRDRQEERASWPRTSSPPSPSSGRRPPVRSRRTWNRSRAARKGPWWDRSDTKWVAEALLSAGVLTTATRVGFARHYDLTENVLPPEVLAREVDDDEAIRELALRAAGALGVATEADIRDYFRLGAAQVKPALAELVADGRARTRRGRRLEGTRVSACRPDRAAPGPRHRAAVPVRPADLLPAAGRAAVRLSLPHRDLRAGAEAPIRLLRMAVPARRPAGRPRRPEGRTSGRRAALSSARSPNRARTRCAWRRRWRPSCGRWQRGWAWVDVTVGSG